MKSFAIFMMTLSLSLLFSACDSSDFREPKVFAGGKKVSAETLNIGKQAYMENCFACHGIKGDGKGVAAKGLFPPPRDLTRGIYKFGEVWDGGLPHDDVLKKIIKKGLNGTAMLPWDIEETRLDALVQYIKTFAPQMWEGADKKLGKKIRMTADPYGLARKATAIQKGKEVYHVVAQCTACHRGYATVDEAKEMTKRIDDSDFELDSQYYQVKIQEADYPYKTLPPDFLVHNVRSASTVKELYVRLMAGVYGSGMPAWQDTLQDSEVWAVAYYVKSLMDLKKNQPERQALLEKLRSSEEQAKALAVINKIKENVVSKETKKKTVAEN